MDRSQSIPRIMGLKKSIGQESQNDLSATHSYPTTRSRVKLTQQSLIGYTSSQILSGVSPSSPLAALGSRRRADRFQKFLGIGWPGLKSKFLSFSFLLYKEPVFTED